MEKLLTVRTATYIVIAAMVGSGVLTTSGYILQTTGSHWINLVLWTLGGIIALTGALTLGEMASGYPKVGGDYVYVRLALGDAWAFVYGWTCLVVAYAAPIALIAYTTGNYFFQPLVIFLQEIQIIDQAPIDAKTFNLVFASIAIVLLTIQHARGHQESSSIQEWTTLFKLAVFAVVLAFGILLLPSNAWDNATTIDVTRRPSPSALALSLVQVMYAYTGWNAAVYIAEELPNPRKTIPVALLRGTIGVTLLYLALNVLYAFTLPVSEIMGFSAEDAGRIAAISIERLVGAPWSHLISALMSLGMLASLSAFILVGPRIIVAMAQDKLVHSKLGEISRKTGVPVWGVAFQGVISIALLWSGTFEHLLNFTGFGMAALSLLAVAVIFGLRKRADYHPTFRVPLYPWTPMIFCITSVLMLIGTAIEAPLQALTGFVCVLVGFPLYYLMLGPRRLG